MLDAANLQGFRRVSSVRSAPHRVRRIDEGTRSSRIQDIWLWFRASDLTSLNACFFQVQVHGRGGQGVVTAAEMLSVAAFREGRQAQAFPSFGSERTGAPVVAFCRIADHEIRAHEPIVRPDALIIQDPTLLHQVDLFSGLSEDGYLLINSALAFAQLGISDLSAKLEPSRVVAVPASEIARETLGRPIANAVLLGGFAALTGVISLRR